MANQTVVINGFPMRIVDNGDGTFSLATSLTAGNLAPLVAAAPVLLATIPFSAFTANATYFVHAQGVLHRNVRARTFMMLNTMDQPLSAAPTLYVYDSSITTTTTYLDPSQAFANAPAATAGFVSLDGGNGTVAGSKVDSCLFGLPMGATVPSQNEVTIYVVEEF